MAAPRIFFPADPVGGWRAAMIALVRAFLDRHP